MRQPIIIIIFNFAVLNLRGSGRGVEPKEKTLPTIGILCMLLGKG